jgi:hypothetical protein
MSTRCLLTLFLSWPILCLADSTLEYQNDANPGNAMTIQISNGNVIMGDGSSKMLFRAGRNEIVIIDHPRRSYMVLDEATAKRAKTQMGDMQQQMAQQMAQMTPEQRAQMAKMFQSGNMPGATTETARTEVQRHGQATIGRIDCEKISLLKKGRVSSRMCIASAGAVGMDSKDYDALLTATDAVKNLVSEITGGMRSPMPMNLRAMNGIPVKMEDLEHGNVTLLKKHSNSNLDGTVFQIPKGYQQRQMM